MHILIIPSAYPTTDHKLRGSFFLEQAIAIQKYGNKVGTIYSETRRVTGITPKKVKEYHFQTTCYNENNINTVRLHGWNILSMRNSIGKKLWKNQMVKLFKTYVETYGKPDILHVHCGLYGGMVATEIKKKYNIPYVVTEHSSNVLNHTINKKDTEWLREVYNNADKLIAVGKRLRKEMGAYTKKEVKVIPNIINTNEFYPKEESKKDKFSFITVCYLKKNKNVDMVIKSFAENFKEDCNKELIIIGDGPENKELQGLAKSLGVSDKVKFLGRVERKDLGNYLRQADVFVLPSSYETFGVAYIEAIASGLPIIVTKCGGPEDFYETSLGYMMEVGDEKKLQELMLLSIEERSQFNKDKLHNYIESRFSEKIIVGKLKETYKKVLSQ